MKGYLLINDGNTPQTLLKLITGIYQASGSQELLDLIAGSLREVMSLGPNAALIPIDPKSGLYQLEGYAIIPHSANWFEKWLIFYSKLDPLMGKIHQGSNHKVLRYTDVILEKTLRQSQFDREFLQPLSIVWMLALPLTCFGEKLGVIWLSRGGESSEEFTETDCEIGTLIAYHAGIALKVQHWREHPPMDMNPGILVLDGFGRTIYQNEESERILMHHSVNWLLENGTQAAPRIMQTDSGVFIAKIFCLQKTPDPLFHSISAETSGRVIVLEPYPPKLLLCQRMKELDLSKRQSEIVLEIMRGRTNKEIALKIGVSLQTVKDHLYTIFQQLKVRNRSELIIRVMGDLSFSGD